MKLLLVFPNNLSVYGVLSTLAAKTPPIQLATYAASLRQYNIGVLDCEGEELTVEQSVNRILLLAPEHVVICTDHLNSGDVSKLEATQDLVEHLPHPSIWLEGVVPTAHPEWFTEWNIKGILPGEAFQGLQDLCEGKEPKKAPFLRSENDDRRASRRMAEPRL